MFQCFYFLGYSHFDFLFSACSSWLLFFPVPPLIHLCHFRLFSYTSSRSSVLMLFLSMYICPVRGFSCTPVCSDAPVKKKFKWSYETSLFVQTLLLYFCVCSNIPPIPLCLFESFFCTSVAVTELFYLCRISTDASSLQLRLFSCSAISICVCSDSATIGTSVSVQTPKPFVVIHPVNLYCQISFAK